MDEMRRTRPRSSGRVALGIALTAAFVMAPRAAAQEPSLPTMTLEQAIDAALRHSPQIAQATGAVENAEWGERSAWGAYLPNLSFSSGASVSSSERFSTETNTVVRGASNESYNAGLSASLDLFDGGRRRAELRSARAEIDAAQAGLIEQRFAVTLAVKQAFFDVLRGDELIRAAQTRIDRAQEGLDAAEQRAAVGSGTRSDVLRAQLELTNARQALLQAQNQQRNATFTLGRLVGADGAVGAEATESYEPQPLALTREELIELVVAEAPMVRTAVAELKAAEANARSARAQYFPTIDVGGRMRWSNNEPTFTNALNSWSLSLGLSFPLFNRFQRMSSVSNASIQADVARVRLADARRAARAQLEQALAALDLAEQQVALTEEAVRVAEEDLRVQQERYRLGVATILEQVTSQVNLVQAETDRIAARYDYQIARAQVEALAGREL
ncbi:MAG TPA: TolC family protein [Longimicrobiales bacterium]